MRGRITIPHSDLDVTQVPIIDLHNYSRQIERGEELCREQLSKHNANLIIEYADYHLSIGHSPAHRNTILKKIRLLTVLYDKDWRKTVTRKDIDRLCIKIVKEKCDKKTGRDGHNSFDMKKLLRGFVRWYITGLHALIDLPNGELDCLRGVRTKNIPNSLVREQLLTEEDRSKMLHACAGNIMMRAFIDAFWDSGGRPGEVLTLRIRDIKIDEYGFKLGVSGKTGQRDIRLVTAVSNMGRWIDMHPFKDNVDWPLWIHTKKGRFGNYWDYDYARNMLIKIGVLAGIKKRVFMNLFRHSEITRSATKYSDAINKKRHGWSPTTKMFARYQHLIEEDVDEAVLLEHGIIKKDKKQAPVFIVCKICNKQNPTESTICFNCMRPLDEYTEENMTEATSMAKVPANINRETFAFLLDMVADPKKASELQKAIARAKDSTQLQN